MECTYTDGVTIYCPTFYSCAPTTASCGAYVTPTVGCVCQARQWLVASAWIPLLLTLLVAFAWNCCMLLQPNLGAFGGIGVGIFFILIGVIVACVRCSRKNHTTVITQPLIYGQGHAAQAAYAPAGQQHGQPPRCEYDGSCYRHAPDHWANVLHLKQNGPVAKP